MTTHKTLPNTTKASLTLIATIFALALALRFYHLDRALGGNDENAMLLYFGYAPLKTIVTNYWDVNNHIFQTINIIWVSLVVSLIFRALIGGYFQRK